jgi:hypothetical protein
VRPVAQGGCGAPIATCHDKSHIKKLDPGSEITQVQGTCDAHAAVRGAYLTGNLHIVGAARTSTAIPWHAVGGSRTGTAIHSHAVGGSRTSTATPVRSFMISAAAQRILPIAGVCNCQLSLQMCRKGHACPHLAAAKHAVRFGQVCNRKCQKRVGADFSFWPKMEYSSFLWRTSTLNVYPV